MICLKVDMELEQETAQTKETKIKARARSDNDQLVVGLLQNAFWLIGHYILLMNTFQK